MIRVDPVTTFFDKQWFKSTAILNHDVFVQGLFRPTCESWELNHQALLAYRTHVKIHLAKPSALSCFGGPSNKFVKIRTNLVPFLCLSEREGNELGTNVSPISELPSVPKWESSPNLFVLDQPDPTVKAAIFAPKACAQGSFRRDQCDRTRLDRISSSRFRRDQSERVTFEADRTISVSTNQNASRPEITEPFAS